MNAYRTPRNPGGFPFGYDWRSTLVGFIALTLINAAATQYVASRFRYQDALGKPLVKNNQFAIYQPFAWSVWVSETARAGTSECANLCFKPKSESLAVR